MIIKVDNNALHIYFIGYAMVLMFMYIILILRSLELFLYTLISLLSFGLIVLLSPFDFFFILPNGGFVYLTVLAVIVNELVSNSVSYAFSNMNNGILYLNFTQNNGECTLEIGDNGCGLSKGFDVETSSSLGLQLVHGLVEELDGSIEIKQNVGVFFSIHFPLNK